MDKHNKYSLSSSVAHADCDTIKTLVIVSNGETSAMSHTYS